MSEKESRSVRAHPAYLKAVTYVIAEQQASVAGVQRKFKLGYAEAEKIIRQMHEDGVVSEAASNGMREVLVKTIEDWNPLARKGAAIERLGVLMQDPKTNLQDLAGAAHNAGLVISVSVDEPQSSE
jgi:hypothetical protein